MNANYYENGVPYVLVSNIAGYLNNDIFKRSKDNRFSKDVIRRTLDTFGIEYITPFVPQIGTNARCYKMSDIYNLVSYNRSKLLDTLTMKKENKPVVAAPEVKKQSATKEPIKLPKPHRVVVDEPYTIPGEDMETASKELLRDQEVWF